jgi:hypothetical protein
VNSFSSLADFVSHSQFRSKLYVLIDDYDDNSVDRALEDAKAYLCQSLYVDPTTDINALDSSTNSKTHQTEQQNLFRRFFCTIKDKLSRGGVGRVFITGETPIALHDFMSGFNISKHITRYEEFEGMCGITDMEVSNVLDQMIPEDPPLKTQLRKLMKDNYSGYMFTTTQSTPIYNTTFVVYFLNEFARLKKIPSKLIDQNVLPSESALEIITNTPLAQQVVYELYQNGDRGMYVPFNISYAISMLDMVNLLQNKRTTFYPSCIIWVLSHRLFYQKERRLVLYSKYQIKSSELNLWI